jgi:hypothetical protein
MSQVNSFGGGGGGGGGTVNTLKGNSGATVGATLGNINVVGDGTTITTTGTLPSTLTISLLPNALATVVYTNVNTTPFVATTNDFYLSVDTSTIPITIQLPNAPTTGRYWVIKDRAGNAEINNITVTTPGGVVTIDGVISYTINTIFQATNIVFNSANYEIW